MAIFPGGFALPPLPYLAALAGAVLAVSALLWRVRPPVTGLTVVAFAPWMVAGASLYALFQVGAVPRIVAPFFGSPAVYLTTFVVAGLVWAGVASAPVDRWRLPSAPGAVGATGTVAMLAGIAIGLWVGATRGSLRLFWPGVGLVVSVVVAAIAWTLIRRTVPPVRVTGRAGALAVFAHTLDGVSTAVGIDVLGFGEQTPLPRAIIDIAAALPTADTLGAGWLFVLVKVAVAAGVVYVLADYVRGAPREGYLLLALVAAVGLGPGAHNLILFAIAGSP